MTRPLTGVNCPHFRGHVTASRFLMIHCIVHCIGCAAIWVPTDAGFDRTTASISHLHASVHPRRRIPRAVGRRCGSRFRFGCLLHHRRRLWRWSAMATWPAGVGRRPRPAPVARRPHSALCRQPDARCARREATRAPLSKDLCARPIGRAGARALTDRGPRCILLARCDARATPSPLGWRHPQTTSLGVTLVRRLVHAIGGGGGGAKLEDGARFNKGPPARAAHSLCGGVAIPQGPRAPPPPRLPRRAAAQGTRSAHGRRSGRHRREEAAAETNALRTHTPAPPYP